MKLVPLLPTIVIMVGIILIPTTLGSIIGDSPSYCDGNCTGLPDGSYALVDCAQFYTCQTGVKTGTQTCPTGQHFSQSVQRCTESSFVSSCECCARSCQEAYDTVVSAGGSTPASGLYNICPTGNLAHNFTSYCDQTTDGGGWMLIHGYKHRANDTTALQAGIVPTNPDNSYSHVHLEDLNKYGYTFTQNNVDEVRLYCETDAHNRKIHFKTSNEFVKNVALTGDLCWNAAHFWNAGFTALANHSGILPAGATGGNSKPGGGFMAFPFNSWDGAGAHWNMRDHGDFLCDDESRHSGVQSNSLFNVWVRLSFPVAVPSMQPSSTPTNIPSSVPTGQPSSLPSQEPSQDPSAGPSLMPSSLPSAPSAAFPSQGPSEPPLLTPSSLPSQDPSAAPSPMPSLLPSAPPSTFPSQGPSLQPSSQPSQAPSAAPSRMPSQACTSALIPVTRTYHFVFSGNTGGLRDEQVADAFKQAYAQLPKVPCSPVLMSVTVTNQNHQRYLQSGSRSQLPQLTGITVEEGHPLHRQLQNTEVNVEVQSSQVSDTTIFYTTSEETAFITSFNSEIQASSGGRSSVASLTSFAFPSSAPSTVPSDPPSTATAPSAVPSNMPSSGPSLVPSALSSNGNCCEQKAWGDHVGRRRCPANNWSCSCPGSECCEVCESTLAGGRKLEMEFEAAAVVSSGRDDRTSSAEPCPVEDQCTTKDGLPGFYLHQKQLVKSYLKGGSMACASHCAPLDAVLESVTSKGWDCGSCGGEDKTVATYM